jgi:calpain-15
MGSSPYYCDCGVSRCEAMTGIKRLPSGEAGKPTLASIEAECAASGKQWTDPDFSANTSALLRDPSMRGAHEDWRKMSWKRPEETRLMKAPTLFIDGANALDITQGAIGDCWFMSAMSVMTQRPSEFSTIFESKEVSAHGVYSLYLYRNGQRVNVLIDSLFPVTASSDVAFGRCSNVNELWVMVLEKAYAKLYRNYEAIESGFVDQALVDLSGGIGSRIDMSKDPTKQQTRNGVIFAQLLSHHAAGYLLGAGSPSGSDSETNASPSGIIQGDGNQLLRMRNPWGRKEWTGDWSDNSDKWSRRMKVKLNWVAADDGAFCKSHAQRAGERRKG